MHHMVNGDVSRCRGDDKLRAHDTQGSALIRYGDRMCVVAEKRDNPRTREPIRDASPGHARDGTPFQAPLLAARMGGPPRHHAA